MDDSALTLPEKAAPDADPAAAPDAGAAGAPALHAPKSRKDYIKDGFENKTKGTEWFNTLTYRDVGYFGVTGVSVGLTWLLNDSKLLSGWFSRLKSGVAESVAKRPDNLLLKPFQGKTNSIMSIGALFTGGTIVSVGLVKWLEDNKARLVKAHDRAHYGEDVVNTDPVIRQAHAELDDAPKQTWLSVFTSRVTAFGLTLLAWVLAGSKNSLLERKTAQIMGKEEGWSLDRMAISVGRTVEGLVHPSAHEQISKASKLSPIDVSRDLRAPDGMFSRIISYLAQDSLYTLITSKALWVSTRIFGPILDKTHHYDEDKSQTHPSATHTPPATPPTPEAEEEADPAKNPARPVIQAETASATRAMPALALQHAAQMS